jgi:hypothetical protein
LAGLWPNGDFRHELLRRQRGGESPCQLYAEEESLMATDEDPPFKEWEQLNEKLEQVEAAHRRGEASKDDVRRIKEE